MAVIKKFKAVKTQQNHLLGIQDLPISEISNILKQAKTFITLNKSSSKKLDILVVGDSKPTKKKIDKAKELKIQIINEKDWYKILNI